MGKARKYKPFSKEDADAYAGKGGLSNFFPVVPKKKKRGRPAKNAKKRGRPPRNNKSPPTPPPHLRKSPPEIAAANNDGNDGVGPVEEDGEEEEDDDVDNEDAGAPKKKRSRINWGAPPHRAKMETAINDWFQKTGDAVDSNGEAIEDAKIFAGLVDIPYNTLYKYIQPNEVTRRILGNGDRGPPKLLDPGDVQFIGETLARADRCNDGASRKEGTDLVMTAAPNISREQARRQLSRRVRSTRRAKSEFPIKVYAMLELAENLFEFSQAVRWLPHGRAFKILNKVKFMEEVVPLFFNQTKIRSFNRQLHLWGFRRIGRGDNQVWYHDSFLRGVPESMKYMVRTKIKGNSTVDTSSDDVRAPNFDNLPPLPICNKQPSAVLHEMESAILKLQSSFGAIAHRDLTMASLPCPEPTNFNGAVLPRHCGLVTSEEHISRLREQYEFVKSIAEINRRSANQKKKKEEDSRKELEKNAPAAAIKLETKNRNVDLLSVREIEAILYQVYNVLMQGKSKLRKSDYVKKLEEEMAKNIAKYELFLSSARAASETTAAVASPENDKELADEAIN